MSRIFVLGPAAQNIYLIDHDDLAPTPIGSASFFGKLPVGANVEIDKLIYTTGGSGLNSAVACARHGHEVILSSHIGNDSAGHAILETLGRENIDNSFIQISPKSPTATTVILLDSKTRQKTTLNHLGVSANTSSFSPQDLDLVSPDWLFATTTNGDMDMLRDFFEKAQANHIKVMFRPGPKELQAPQKLLGLLEDVDILYLNKASAQKLIPSSSLAELFLHLKNYTNTVIITTGPMGGIAGDQKATYRFGLYEDIKIKDPTGVGDAFSASFLAHYTAKNSLKSSLVFASASATNTLTNIGPQTGLLTGAEKLHLMPIQKL